MIAWGLELNLWFQDVLLIKCITKNLRFLLQSYDNILNLTTHNEGIDILSSIRIAVIDIGKSDLNINNKSLIYWQISMTCHSL